MNIFFEEVRKVAKHNELYELGFVTYKAAINTFSDWTPQEFLQYASCVNGSSTSRWNPFKDRRFKFKRPPYARLPESVDWRKLGAVTPAQDQGRCNSCWSFAITGTIEGQHFRKNNVLVSLSEQNLIDCSRGYGPLGCKNGELFGALQYVIENNGIDTENSYPYEGKDGECRYNPRYIGATVTATAYIGEGTEEALKAAVALIGPIAVVFKAIESFKRYDQGIYYDPECNQQQVDLFHALLVIGYGTENGEDYWLVKNSWGTNWGEDGYGKIARNRNNHCGIASSGVYPLI